MGALSNSAVTEVQPKVQAALPRFSAGRTSRKYKPPTVSRNKYTMKDR